MHNTSEDTVSTRPRRATGVDRDVSMALSGTTVVASLDSPAHLRSSDSIGRKRSGTSSQTLSVVTTDSSSSVEERKFKDDKGKRAMVIREILLYVSIVQSGFRCSSQSTGPNGHTCKASKTSSTSMSSLLPSPSTYSVASGRPRTLRFPHLSVKSSLVV